MLAADRENTPLPPEREAARGPVAFSRWRRDLSVVAVCVAVTFGLSARDNLAELLRRLTRPYEYLQLDELPVVLLVAAAGLAWFAWRRYGEARRELAQREVMERRLADTLHAKNRLARRLMDAQEAERRSLARELHDELGQYLNAIKLDAVAIGGHASRSPLRERAQAIVESVERVHRVVQTMIRRFRPVALDELGLEAALQHSLGEWQRRMPGVALHLRTTGGLGQCGESANLAVYRMVQEGLTNVSRHAYARRVEVSLDRCAGEGDVREAIHLTIEDDGVGVDLRVRGPGLGLVGMRERAELLGGQFHVASAPGRGFSLRATLPVTGTEPAT